MNKIILIFKREYLTRVKKKQFLLLTLLMPIMFGGIMAFSIYMQTRGSDEKLVAVVDRSEMFADKLESSKSTKFEFVKAERYDKIKENMKGNKFYALLEIPENVLETNEVKMFSHKQITIDLKIYINRRIERILENQKRAELIASIGVPDLEKKLNATKTHINVETIKMGEDGKSKKGSAEIATVVGMISGVLIYMFVFIYGSMVMRGVLEEKQNRIVEVIISSVKPIQLMMGKILGLAAVGLTQFAIWVILMGAMFIGAQSFIMPENAEQMLQQMNQSGEMMSLANPTAAQMAESVDLTEMQETFMNLQNINFTGIIIAFFVYFMLGYLLYSSLMAAVASAVDTEEDMQQFLLPITIPLIAAIIMLSNVVKDPEGSIAFWGSYIPFTSPIIMMVRIPFGVPWWEILISLTILASFTYGCVWMAAKIYRTGILMYGKKPTWKELAKWLTYRN